MYELTPSAKPDTVHGKADNVVGGQRGPMGEPDLAYVAGGGCCRVEFSSPRVRGVWCPGVTGTHFSGVLWLLPGQVKVRQVDVDKR